MNPKYYISLNIKSHSSYESFGRYYLGGQYDIAVEIFGMLKGDEEVSESSVLYMDFTEVKDGIPLTVGLLHCNIEELAYNTRVITREIFKQYNLET